MEEIITVNEINETDLTFSDIAKIFKVAPGTIRIYFGREDFNNVEKIRYNRKIYYRNVTEENIKMLENLIVRKRGGYTY